MKIRMQMMYSLLACLSIVGVAHALTQEQGSFTMTYATGATTAPTATCKYALVDKVASVWCNAALSATSNASGMTFTGLPANLYPTVARSALAPCTDNAGVVLCRASVGTNGTITFGMGAAFSATGFTTSAAKGVPAGWAISFIVD